MVVVAGLEPAKTLGQLVYSQSALPLAYTTETLLVGLEGVEPSRFPTSSSGLRVCHSARGRLLSLRRPKEKIRPVSFFGRAARIRTEMLAHEGLSFACLPFHHSPNKLAETGRLELPSLAGACFRDRCHCHSGHASVELESALQDDGWIRRRMDPSSRIAQTNNSAPTGASQLAVTIAMSES